MSEDDAIDKAFDILGRADDRLLTDQDGEELSALKEYIAEDKFDDIWGAYMTSYDQNTQGK